MAAPENQPLKIAGYVLLSVAGIAALIGLINLASGGPDAAPGDPSAQAAPSTTETSPPIALPPSSDTPAVPPPAEPPPPGLAAPAPGAPAPGAPAPGAPGAPAPAAPAQPAPAQPAPALPGAGLPAAGSPSGTGAKGRASSAKAPVRVYNNSLVQGLADRAADDMRDSGWTVTEVSNWSASNIPTSTVYYRPGTSEQSAARNLANDFGLRIEPRFAGIQDASPGLIVIVTKDFQRR